MRTTYSMAAPVCWCFTLSFGLGFAAAQTPAPVLTVPNLDKNGIEDVCFTGGGQKYLVTNGSDDDIKFWEPGTGRLVKKLTFGDYFTPRALAWTPTGNLLAVADFTRVAWVNPVTFSVRRSERMPAADRAKEHEYSAAVFSHDGKTLYVGGGSYTELSLWKVTANGTVLTKMGTAEMGRQGSAPAGVSTESVGRGVKSMTLSPDGRTLIVSAGLQEAFRVNTADGKVSRLTQIDGNCHTYTKQSRLVGSLYVESSRSSVIKVYEGESLRELASLRVSYKVVFLVAFPKSNKVLVGGESRWAVLDVDKAQWDAQGNWPVGGVKAAAVSTGENLIAIGGFDNGASVLSLYDWKSDREVLSVGASVFQSGSIYPAANASRFLITRYAAAGQVKILRIDQGSLAVRSLPFFQATHHAAVSNDGRQIVLSGREQTLAFNSFPSTQYATVLHDIKNFRPRVVLSSDGSLSAVLTNDGAWIYETSTRKLLKKLGLKGRSMGDITLNSDSREVLDAAFSPDGRLMAASCAALLGLRRSLRLLDVNTEEEIWKLENANYSNLRFSPDGKELFAVHAAGSEVKAVWLDPKNGAVLRSVRLDYPVGNWDNYMEAGSVANDCSAMLVTHGKEVVLYDLKTGKALGKYTPNGTLYSAALLPGSHYGLVAHASFAAEDAYHNALEVYDFAQQRLLARIFLFDNSDDWAVITPGGHYDASPGAMRRMYYVQGTATIGLEALSAKFYVPRLLGQLLQGYAPPPDEINNIKKPPVVKISPPSVQRNLVVDDEALIRRYEVSEEKIALFVEATAPEDRVAEIRLFHNGKRVGTDARNLVVEDDEPPSTQKNQRYEVILQEGDNHFRAIALNQQSLESTPDEIVVYYKPTNVRPADIPNIQLHLLIIGINRYKNPKYNLNYATADASAFKNVLEEAATGLFSKVNTYYLSDEQANRENILGALDKVSSASRPTDVFVFYYAGHGVLNERREFFLVPHDVTQLYGADQALAQRGISAEVLHRYAKAIPAQKQLYLLDACQSAGALNQGAVRGAAEEKVISQLARATGTHWIAASGSEQFAGEFAQLGHGAFTYGLLEALSGKADSGDKRVTVREIDAYLQAVVPELTAKYKGLPQYPASFGFGNDFPLVIIRR
jgi:WD40 repeat protein